MLDNVRLQEESNIQPKSSSIDCMDLSYQVNAISLVEQINCAFVAGKISVILGKNGAGKSTLLSLLTKEITPSSGSINWQSTPLQTLSFADLALSRAVLPQLQNVVFSLTVRQMVSLGAQVQADEQPQLIIDAVMQVCDIVHLAQRDVMTLSGGEQKRVQLARVLAQIWPIEALKTQQTRPFLGKWLFLDEWTTSLDLHHQQVLAQYFKQWASQGLGIIMVLHDLNLTAQLADEVKLLNQGQLVLQGTVKTVFTQQTIQNVLGLQVEIVHQQGLQAPIIVPTM